MLRSIRPVPTPSQELPGLPLGKAAPHEAAPVTFAAPVESPRVRQGYALAALVLLIGFFAFHHTYWVPANGGVDQNGYFVGGKEYARHWSPRQTLVNPYTGQLDPYLFVGTMWIGADLGTPAERYYPKYPLGLPMLVAAALKIGGPHYGPMLAYWIDPLAMTIAVGATFLLVRLVAGSFAGLLGMLIFATSPVTLGLTNEANSHAGAVCCAAVGMLLLLYWWRKTPGKEFSVLSAQGSVDPSSPRTEHRAPSTEHSFQAHSWLDYLLPLAAGLFLGYAATIRYTEATLLGAAGVVILFKLLPPLLPRLRALFRRLYDRLEIAALRLAGAFHARRVPMMPHPGVLRDWLRHLAGDPADAVPTGAFPPFPKRNLLESLALLVGWAIPVGYLVCFNLYAFGALTGYDPTNESSGFRLEYFEVNWETMLRQLNNLGLYLVFPLALAGLLWMFWWSWRLACILAAWIVPCLAIYTFYYWAPDGNNIGYLRFFLTIMPALTLCAFWLLTELTRPKPGDFSAQISTTRPPHTTRAARPAPAIIMGVLTAIALLLNLQGSLPHLESQERGNLMLHRAADEAKGFANIPPAIPDGSVVFGPQHILHYLQFISDDVLYDGQLFNTATVRRMAKVDPDEPQYLAPQRAKVIYERLKGFNDRQLIAEQQRVVLEALDHHRRVFFIIPHNQLAATRLRFAPTRLKKPDRFDLKTIAAWNDPNLAPRQKRETAPRRRPPRVPESNPKQSLWYIVEVKRATTPPDTSADAVLHATEMLHAG
jgi:hypothetical protein